MKTELKKLLFSMIKIGTVGFGGGSALIPVIEHEIVLEKKIISEEEFDKDVIVANITPGALPVEIAGQVGSKVAGVRGMLSSATMMALPGAVLTLLVIAVLSNLDNEILTQVEYLAVGITGFIACLLTEYVKNVLNEFKNDGRNSKAIFIMLVVFTLTVGKNFVRIFQLDNYPVFKLSTLDVLVVAFFVIIVTKCSLKNWKALFAVLVSLIFVLCSFGLIKSNNVFLLVKIVMLFWVIYSFKVSLYGGEHTTEVSATKMLKEVFGCIMFFIILSIPAFILKENSLFFFKNGWISSLLSFGGGDAYLTVADGLFVSNKLISEEAFYGTIVPVVNVLPGSILCKTLTGIGYYFGFETTKNIGMGIVVAMAGFGCSVAASCGVVAIVRYLYEKFESMDVFRLIKRWIRPIISGLLLTVISSLVYQNIRIGIEYSNRYIYVLYMLLIYIVDIVFLEKYKKKSGFLIIISIIMSLLLCNIF